MSVEKRFRALRLIGSVFKALGILCGVVGILGACGLTLAAMAGGAILSGVAKDAGLGANSAVAGIGAGIGILLIALIYGLALYAVGESIYLQLAIEENTRLTAAALDQLRMAWMRGTPPSGPTMSNVGTGDPFAR